jgi:hypothetical protein
MLVRTNTAHRLTANLLERELSSQAAGMAHLRVSDAHAAASARLVHASASAQQAPSGVVAGRKTAAEYANEMDAQTSSGKAPKESHWAIVRRRLPEILRLKDQPLLLETPSAPVVAPSRSWFTQSTRNGPKLSGISGRLFHVFHRSAVNPETESASDFSTARRASDSTVASSSADGGLGEETAELASAAKRNQAERDRLAAARERAREKAMRAAQREERETTDMIEVRAHP